MAAATERRDPVRGSGYLFGGRVVVSAISLAGTALVARALSPSDWGAYTFILSFTTILDLVFDFQVGRLVVAELVRAKREPGRVMGSFIVLRLCLATAGYLAAILFAAVGPYPPSLVPAMAVGALTIVFGAGWNALFLYFQIRLWLRSVSIVLVTARLVFVALVAGFFLSGSQSLVAYLWATVANEFVPFLVLLLILRRHLRLRPLIEPGRWWQWLKDAIPIAVGFAIGSIYLRIDSVLLSMLDTLQAVGLYGIGYKFSDLLGYLSTALLLPAFTLFVRAWPEHPESFRRNWRGSFVLSTIAAVGGSAAFFVFARPAIVLLFGSQYGVASTAARLLVIGQAIRFFVALGVITLIAVGRTRAYVVASVVGLAINIGANLVVIPRFSYVGAAWVTVGTELVVAAVLARALWSIPNLLPPPWAIVGRAILAGAALIAVGVLLDTVAPWPLAALGAGGVFLAVLHIVGVDGSGGLRVVPRLLSDEGLARKEVPPRPWLS
jgi:O-antigen/teichoic acid export membrane protein